MGTNWISTPLPPPPLKIESGWSMLTGYDICFSNYRFTAYRQYTAWSHYFERLGRGKRVIIPACVIKQIRDTFPSSDGVYKGFRDLKL